MISKRLFDDKAELGSLSGHTKLMPLRYKVELDGLPAERNKSTFGITQMIDCSL
jgi:hypothetical protein